MIRQIEAKLIPVGAIDMDQRDRQPSELEVDQMVTSIREVGLLTAIGVRASGSAFRLVYGATRLSAIKKLGRCEVPCVIYDGTPEEFASAEIIENLERRHLDKDELDQLTKTLVELRTKESQGALQKELDDTPSHNSSHQPKTHPKKKVEGAKRGRPETAGGKAKREVAAETGQSVRNVQRITSEKPKATASRGAATVGDPALKEFTGHCARLLQQIKGAKPDRFIKTGLEPDDLNKLARYLSETADLKSNRSPAAQGSVDQSAQDSTAINGALGTPDAQEAA